MNRKPVVGSIVNVYLSQQDAQQFRISPGVAGAGVVTKVDDKTYCISVAIIHFGTSIVHLYDVAFYPSSGPIPTATTYATWPPSETREDEPANKKSEIEWRATLRAAIYHSRTIHSASLHNKQHTSSVATSNSKCNHVWAEHRIGEEIIGAGSIAFCTKCGQIGDGHNLSHEPDTTTLTYAQNLAKSLWQRHYAESAPQWKPLDDVLGVLTQIDNMVCGLAKPATAAHARVMTADEVFGIVAGVLEDPLIVEDLREGSPILVEPEDWIKFAIALLAAQPVSVDGVPTSEVWAAVGHSMPQLNDTMRAVLCNEHGTYGSEDALYAALVLAANAQAALQRIADNERELGLDIYADAQAPVAIPGKLTVWYGSMPESNGKSNWTAILHRGDLSEGHTLDRSEYPDRVRYEADRVRWLLGEIEKKPFILDYDADKRSDYGAPAQHWINREDE